jgi:hypothetical protein
VNALSYQPTSPIPSDVDCGVVATYKHRYMGVLGVLGLLWNSIAETGGAYAYAGVERL